MTQPASRGLSRQGLGADFAADEAAKSDLLLAAQLLRAQGRAEEAADQFVQRAGLKPDELTAMPGPTEPANQSCCPRCGAQFVTRTGTCSDCGGRPLEPFKHADVT